METDKSATILEAQWMEREIPRIEEELRDLQAAEQELLTAPLETVRQAYTDTYRAGRKLAHTFYHRRRSVRATGGGYRARTREAGWFVILARILIAVAVVAAGYVAYRNYQAGDTQKAVTQGSVLLIAGLVLAFVPALGDWIWDRQSRRAAERAAQEARQSVEFLQEKQDRQLELSGEILLRIIARNPLKIHVVCCLRRGNAAQHYDRRTSNSKCLKHCCPFNGLTHFLRSMPLSRQLIVRHA